MDAQPMVQVPSDVLIRRIDAIMDELQELRRLVLSQSQPQESPPDIVAQLAGALASKPRPEGFSAFEEYDTVTEWERFADDTNE
ncbi:MAG TPA: hypothetical protein VMY40_07390 [Anaerolineae bacterium]|nr:hypothetical protein [Anaerolineae bacterium]